MSGSEKSAEAGETPVEIRIEDLHVAFGSHQVLRGIDLEILRGDMVAIVGGSGCGKTVLLQCMLGHRQPDRGRVWIADHEVEGSPLLQIGDLDDAQMQHVRRHWAVVFQRNALFSGTVLENVGLWLQEVAGLEDDAEIRRRVVRALKSVGFSPDEALLQKQRDELSGGMQKRVAVARALAMDPILTFFDEPTTGLDPTLGAQVHELIRTVHANPHAEALARTTVLITHDKDLLYRLEPRVVMIHEGHAEFDGSYAEFAASESPVVRPYFDLMPGLHAQPKRPAGP